MTCPAVVKVTVPSGPAVVRVVTAGPQGPVAEFPPILETLRVLTDDYSITAGSNGLSVGPVEIQSGITVTIPSDSVWRLI
jgi:hypothetical protein